MQDVTTCKLLERETKKNSDQGDVWTSLLCSCDWAEAQRLLKVSCHSHLHSLKGGEKWVLYYYNLPPGLGFYSCYLCSHMSPSPLGFKTRFLLPAWKKAAHIAVPVSGSQMKRVKPRETAAGSSLFLIYTPSWLSMWVLPTSCSGFYSLPFSSSTLSPLLLLSFALFLLHFAFISTFLCFSLSLL